MTSHGPSFWSMKHAREKGKENHDLRRTRKAFSYKCNVGIISKYFTKKCEHFERHSS